MMQRPKPLPPYPDDHTRITIINPSEELKKRVSDLEIDVAELKVALNESRDQIQALLDYCFTDRSGWAEGHKLNSSIPQSNKNTK